MSIKYNDKTNNQEILLAGISSVDQILNGNSKNAIANKAVYNALQEKIEKSVNDLVYYYSKNDVYNKTEVRQLIGAINTLTIEVVGNLPTTDISTTTIYFVGPATGTNTYDEYVYVNNTWVKIGDTDIDLSDYVTSANLTTILQSYYTKAEVNNLFNSYYTKSEVNTLLDNVEIDVDDALSASSTNPVQNKVIKAKIDDIEDEIDTKQDKEFIGTTAQWNALTTEQKNQYVLVNLTDDEQTNDISKDIIVERISLPDATIAANSFGSTTGHVDKTGYIPLGIIGLNTLSGSSNTPLIEFVLNRTNQTAVVYWRNISSSEATISGVNVDVLYIKNHTI